MVKIISFVEIPCYTCGYVMLIPTYDEFKVVGPVHCEEFGKAITMKIHARDIDKNIMGTILARAQTQMFITSN